MSPKVAKALKGAALAYAGIRLDQQRTEDTWHVVDAPPPPVPEGYKPIVSAALPCTPQELYGILFSGATGTELYLRQHREIGRQWDLAATGWRRAGVAGGGGAGGAGGVEDGSLLGAKSVFEYVLGVPGSGGFTRLLTFVNPKKASAPDTRCVQRQQLCAYRGGVLLFATAMNMLDIPFKDCFTVNTLWSAAPGQAPGTCDLTIMLKVNFVKRAMGVGGIIVATTHRDTTAFYAAFTAAVTQHLAALRERAAAPLPAPLPAEAAACTAGGPSGGAAARAGGAPPLAHAHSSHTSTAAHAPAPLRSSMAVWKQLRALLVFALLAATLLHQLHLAQQLAALRAAAGLGAAGGTAEGSEGGVAAALGAGVAQLASAGGQALAGVAGQVAAAAGVLQALLGGRGGAAAAAAHHAQ